MTPKRLMRLGTFLSAGDQHVAAWRHPQNRFLSGGNFEHYREALRICEEAFFDLILLGDVHPNSEDPMEALSRHATYDRLEPLTLMGALSVVSRNIGLVATASTTYNEPFHIARKFASLDQLSGGRAGWNVVTTAQTTDAYNFSRSEHAGHDDRYTRAEEFVDVVRGLWHSWDDDAFIRDKESGVYFRPEGLHWLNHKGAHFSVKGPIDVTRSPQGHPVLVQAGSSEPGKALASRVAEVIFTAHQTLPDAQKFYRDVKARVAANGRSPDHAQILIGLLPVVGRTKAEAEAKFEEYQSLIHPAVSLFRLGHILGNVDLSIYPLDEPPPSELPETAGILSRRQSILGMARRENMTLRQLAARIGGTRGHWTLVGTPEMLADQMQEWFENEGADGYLLFPTSLLNGLPDFTETVVPELRRRGLVRTAYAGATLRENLGLPIPKNPPE